MKTIFFIIILLPLMNVGCEKSNNLKEKEKMITNETVQENQITYSIDATATIPVIIYFNDIKISEENTPVNSSVDLNAFALKNGKYKVKIQIFPVFRRGDTSVSPEDIKSCKFNFVSFIRNKETQDISQYNTISQLSIKVPEAPVPYFEQEWEVDLTKLPYDLNGWNTGEDLRKMNQKELEKKVINYHEKIRNILNKGNAEEWANLTKKRFQETAVFYYNNEKQYQKSLDENLESVKKYCTDMMIPLEDYEMKIYAEGKLVTLERKKHTKEFNNKSPLDLKGWSPLIRKGQKSGAADYRILLYLPQGSNEFVIIRK